MLGGRGGMEGIPGTDVCAEARTDDPRWGFKSVLCKQLHMAKR